MGAKQPDRRVLLDCRLELADSTLVADGIAEVEAAERALDHFAFRVRREIGALAASIGGLDALVFTAGIGENARGLRWRICEGLGSALNQANAPEISSPGAAVKVLVRHTDEERMIAEHTLDIVAAHRTAQAQGTAH